MASADLRLVAALAGGSVRRAIVLLHGDGIELYRRFAALACARRPDLSEIHALASELSPVAADDRYRLLLDIAHDFIARRVRSEREPGMDDAMTFNRHGGLAGWVEVWEKTRHSAHLADTWNLDRKQVILNLFSAMHEAA
jgi:DNA polymerase-3 subunit delta'